MVDRVPDEVVPEDSKGLSLISLSAKLPSIDAKLASNNYSSGRISTVLIFFKEPPRGG